MKVGYGRERLHHALHPLFLNMDPNCEWYTGPDQGGAWYIGEGETGYMVRNPEGNVLVDKDMYGLKRFCYDYFQRRENIRLPWGIISGIRPGKLARQIYNQNPLMTQADFQAQIWKLDRVSAEKAGLLWQVLKVENDYLKRVEDKPGLHLYVGIPFCPSRCFYCSFSAGIAKSNDPKLEEYVQLLVEELDGLNPVWTGRKIRTIYIGGGTPSILNASLLETLLAQISQRIKISEVEEFTLEAGRPDTITLDKLKILKEYGVDRISINPQSFSDQTLSQIGRSHSVEDIIRTYAWAKDLGFIVNMDLIFGLNGEGMGQVEKALSQIRNLRPDNVTVHTLTPKRGADLSGAQKQGIQEISQSIGQMLDFWHLNMEALGLVPYYLYRQKNIYYENIGYARPGRECIYNMETMLEKESVLALGAGSISKKVDMEKIRRYDMPKAMDAYRKQVKEGLGKKLAFFSK